MQWANSAPVKENFWILDHREWNHISTAAIFPPPTQATRYADYHSGRMAQSRSRGPARNWAPDQPGLIHHNLHCPRPTSYPGRSVAAPALPLEVSASSGNPDLARPTHRRTYTPSRAEASSSPGSCLFKPDGTCHELLDGLYRQEEAFRAEVVAEKIEAFLDPSNESLVGMFFQA